MTTRQHVAFGILLPLILGGILTSCASAREWPKRLVRWPTRITAAPAAVAPPEAHRGDDPQDAASPTTFLPQDAGMASSPCANGVCGTRAGRSASVNSTTAPGAVRSRLFRFFRR